MLGNDCRKRIVDEHGMDNKMITSQKKQQRRAKMSGDAAALGGVMLKTIYVNAGVSVATLM